MLFIETKDVDPNPKLAVMKFDIIKNADGSESYRSVARKESTDPSESGTPIYSVTPNGDDEWRADPGGPWESFKRVGQTLVADRGEPGNENAYIRFCVEAS
jgi:hypothetical protein